MNCQQAKEQIDERAVGPVQGGRANDAALDAHVASCAACREYARAVAATSKLLAGVRADRPSNEEMADMWNTLALSLPGQGAGTVKAARKSRPWLRIAVYSASVAAVLMVAIQLGSLQYTGDLWIPGKSKLSRSRGYVAQNMRYEALRSDTQLSGVDNFQPLPHINSGVVRSSQNAVAPPSSPTVATTQSELKGLRGLGYVDGASRAVPEQSSSSSESSIKHRTSRKSFTTSEVPASVSDQSNGGTKSGEWPAIANRSSRTGGPPRGELRPSSPGAFEKPIPYVIDAAATEVPSRPARTGGGQSVFGGSSSGSGISYDQIPEEFRNQSPEFLAGYLAERSANMDLTYSLDAGIPGQTGSASGGGGAAGQAASEEGQASNIPSSAKIIRTGLLNIEVPVYANVATQVEQIVAAHRGFIGDSNVVEQTGGAIVGTVVIRVPAEQFEGLFAALKGLGRVVSEHSDTDDVTAAYVDLEARIVSQRVTEERLHDLVRNKTIVDKVSALLEVERELQRVRSDIERMQGELRVMADRVALSTITLTLSEPKRIVPTASLSVEVGTVDEAGAALGVTLTTLNGRLSSGKTHKRSDGTLMATYQLQVPLSRFNELLDAVAAMGRIEERQISDHEFSAVKEPWAANVQCSVALTVFERSRQQPSGTIFVEARNLEEAVKKLETVLEPTAARIVSSYSVVDPQGASKAEVSLSVPAASFSELVARLGQLGRVQSQSITGETKNASGGAASVLCSIRLTITEVVREVPTGQIIVEVAKFDAARAAVATLVSEKSLQVLDSSSQQNVDGSWRANFELGVEAKDMEEVVGRLEGLGRVASRNMQGIGLGSLSRTDPKALGHLSVSIAEKSAIAPAPEQAGQTLRTHLRDGLEGLYKSVGLIAYGLIVMGPWLAIAILVGWLIGRVRGRRTSAKP